MSEVLNILPNDTTFAGLEFQELRRKGLEHIARLSGNVWTDHNLHDPGITILEVLCYALADLGYRTRLPIEDLLARDPADKTKDDNFFTPAEILTNNPLTIDDYRRMLLDIPGVRNAWLEIADRNETDIYVDCTFKRLRFNDLPDAPSPGELEKLECQPVDSPVFRKIKYTPLRRLVLNGLYNVYLELEPTLPRDPATAACSGEEEAFDRILEEVRQKLHAHRNLCEDFLDIIVLRKEQIAVCGDVELTPDAEPEKVLADLFEAIQDFLSPAIPFYTLEEMLQRGRSIEEIFEGRPMTLDSHGFIDPDDLTKLKRHTEIHASDIYRVMMSVPGVRAVKKLYLLNYLDGTPQTTGEQWCLRLTPLHHPVLSPELSGLSFSKGVLTIPVDKKKAMETLGKRLNNFRKVKRRPEELDGSVPKGIYRSDLGAYRSIIHEFPVTYAIGERQLSDRATPLRKAQVRQLQGYLLFFDQLLANYLGQLSNLRQLFSLRTDCPANGTASCPEDNPDLHRDITRQRTYFESPLTDVPDATQLLRYFSPTSGNSTDGIHFSLNQTLGRGLNTDVAGNIPSEIFTTPEDRDMALMRLQKAFDNGLAHAVTSEELNGDGEKRFRFFIEDNLGRRLLRSHVLYETKEQALLVAEELKLLGTMEQVYQKQDNQKKSRYTFQLVFNPLSYAAYLRSITENRRLYLQRRDKMLTHLLARFNEQFTDYVLLMYALNQKSYDPERIIQDKAWFLSNYPGISRNRGAAINYIDAAETWNTRNISGLERRVTSLMGIRDWKRRYLSNFEVIGRTDRYRPVIKDHRGCTIFISPKGYPTTHEADEAWQKMVEFAKKTENYRCFGCSADSVYGFELLDDNNCLVASHPFFYPTPQQRDAAKKCIKAWIADGFLPRGTGTSKEGFYFTLDDGEGKRLLENPDPFSNEDEAWNAWFGFIEAAQDTANYHLRQDPVSGGYYFLVGKMEAGEFVTLAVHRKTAPEIETKEKMEQSAVFIQKKYAPPVLVGGEDRFGWELFDGGGNVLMFSHLDRKDLPETLGLPGNRFVFIDRLQAVAALVEALDAANRPGNFIRAGQPSELRFFFRLEKETDLTIAGSPVFSETSEREQAIEKVIAFAADWRQNMLEINSGFSFLLYNSADPEQKWFNGSHIYRDQETALLEGEAAVRRLCDKEALSIGWEEGFCSYHIELKDACGELLAVSPGYQSLEEAEREKTKIVAAAQRSRVGVAANPVANAIGARIQTPDNKTVLRSYRLFHTEAEALLTWLELFGRGKTETHFEKIDAGHCDFSYRLLDECTRPLGIAPKVYNSPQKRDKRLADLVCYLQGQTSPFDIGSVQGPIRFLVKGTLENQTGPCTLMEGARWHDGVFGAKKDYWRFLCPAGNPENYRPLPDPDGCRFGFSVVDKEESPTGHHPVFYPKEKPSLEKQEAIQAWMREHCYAFDVRLMPGKWFMQVLWRDCDGCCRPLLTGPERDTEEEALNDLEQLLLLLPDNFQLHPYTDEITQLPSFYLSEKGKDLRLAWHPGGFIDVCLRNAQMADAAVYLASGVAAMEPTHISALVCDKEKVTGRAEHPLTYAVPGLRNQALESLFTKIAGNIDASFSSISELENDRFLQESPGIFRYRLRDGKTRQTLWHSLQTYPSKEEALAAWETDLLRIVELARNPGNYRKFDHPATSLQVHLSDEQGNAIVSIPASLLTAANIDGMIQQRIDHALLFPFFPQGNRIGFRLYDLDAHEVLLRGTATYHTLSRAKEGFATFRRLLTNRKNWVGTTLTSADPEDPEQEITRYSFTVQQNGELFGYRLRRRDEKVAVHPIRYPDCNKRDEELKALWKMVKKGAGHLYSSIYEGRDLVFKATTARPGLSLCDEPMGGLYHYRLIDDETGTVLWISWKGYPTEAEALDAFEKEYVNIVTLARRKSNYRMPAPADDAKTILLLNEKGKPVAEIPPGDGSEDADAARMLRHHHALRFPVLKEGKTYVFQLFNLAQRRLLWKSAAMYESAESAWQAFDLFLQLLSYPGNWLPDGGSECGSWGFYLGNVLLESTHLYLSEEEAWESLKDFLLAVQQEEGINRLKNYAAGCCFALDAVGEAFRVARHPRRFRTYEEREVALRWLLQRAKCRDRLFSEIEGEVKCSGGEFYFFMKDKLTNELLWRSFGGYPTATAAEKAFEAEQYNILEWAEQPGFYSLVRNAEGLCEVHLVNLDGQPVAVIPQTFQPADSEARLQAILVRIYHARLYPFFKSKDGYGFQLYDPAYDAAWLEAQAKRIIEGETLPPCEHTGYRDACLPTTPEAELPPGDCGCQEQSRLFDQLSKSLKGGVVWESMRLYANRNLLECAFDHFIQNLVKDPRAYHRGGAGDCGPFFIELADPAQRLAIHPRCYPSHQAREAGIADVRSAIDAEGFHVLEHILLRPIQPSEDEYFVYAQFPVFEPADDGGGGDDSVDKRTVVPPLAGAGGASTTATVQLFDRGFSEKQDICAFLKELWREVKGKINPELSQAENIANLLNELRLRDLSMLREGWEQFLQFIFQQGLQTDDPQLPGQPRWMVYLFARNHGALQAACDLLPICPEGCDEVPRPEDLGYLEASACGTEEELAQDKIYLSYLPGADPYSFWATVVIPFWSRRFLNTNFRTFFEETIRRELPAQVAVRIIWVNPRQMGEFEQRYRAWLEAKAGLADCDLQKTQRYLIKILLDLKNEYLPARLFDCEAGGQTDIIFLDQTKLG